MRVYLCWWFGWHKWDAIRALTDLGPSGRQCRHCKLIEACVADAWVECV